MSVCHNCPKRYVGCKLNCPDWETEKQKDALKKMIIQRNKEKESLDYFSRRKYIRALAERAREH